MSYLVLARKWRPKTFSEVVGQDHVVTALKNSLKSDSVHQAFLFTGTRGVGKTSLARILTKALNCRNLIEGEPCNDCDSCNEINAGSSIDFQEIDAASRRGISETKELLETIPYLPTSSKYKVYLIDEVHMLTKESFNSLLKTLEEPPPHVIFMFATTEFEQIPPTILSRCLQLNLNSVTVEGLTEQLSKIFSKEKIKFEKSALDLISDAANGSIRDALTISEKIISYSEKNITEEIVREVLGIPDERLVEELLLNLKDKNTDELFENLKEISNDTSIKNIFINLMNLIKKVSINQFSQKKDNTFNSSLLEIDPESLQIFYQLCLVNIEYIDDSPDPKGLFEMTLLKMLAFDLEEKKNSSVTEKGKNYNWSDLLSELKLGKVLTQHLMHSNGILQNEKFIISLPEEKKNLLSEKNLKIIENQLRDFFSIRDLKIKIDTNYDLSTSPINLKEESVKRNEEIVKEKIKKSDSYKKIVSELKPEIKKFDNSE